MAFQRYIAIRGTPGMKYSPIPVVKIKKYGKTVVLSMNRTFCIKYFSQITDVTKDFTLKGILFYDVDANKIGIQVTKEETFGGLSIVNKKSAARILISGLVKQYPQIADGTYTNISNQNVDGLDLIVIDMEADKRE